MNSNRPDEKEIAQKAYQLWEAEGRPEGRDVAHWHQAERDVSEPVTQPIEEMAPDVAPEGASDLDPAAASDIVPVADPALAAEAGASEDAPEKETTVAAKPKRTRKPKVVADEAAPAEPKAKTPRRRKADASGA